MIAADLHEDDALPARRALSAFPAIAALCAALYGAGPALAADPPPANLSADDKALVQKATDYIQNLKGVEGKFTQTDPKGQASTGAFFMQRPGKARFQYAPPAQLLVVADGSDVSVYDRKLKTFEQYPLEQTPLMLLLAKTVRLDRGIVITAVDRSKDGFAIAARDAHNQTQGQLTIRFSQNPIALSGWTVTDAQGRKTEVRLSGLHEKPSLPADLFVLRDPHPHAAQP